MANFDTLKATIAARIPDNTDQLIDAEDVRQSFLDTIDDMDAAKADAGAGDTAVWGHITGDLDDQTDLGTALAGKQDTISDLSTIRSGAAAGATAYQKPSGGIPSSDLATAVQTSLGKADTAYQKPSGGIPSTDMASAVQTSLGKADTAYQKPSGGIPNSDLSSGVQTSLGAADTAVQPAAVADVLRYTSQSLTSSQQGQARTNIGALSSADVASLTAEEYVVVASLPTASASTIGKIYLVGPDGNGEYDRYITSESGGTYSWVQIGSTSVDLSDYVLHDDFDDLEEEVNGKDTETKTSKSLSSYTSYGRWLTNVGKWNSGSGALGIFVPITPGKKYGVLYTQTGGSHYGVLKSMNMTVNTVADFATGYSNRVPCADDVESTFTAPSDANYLFLLTQFSNTPFSVTLYEYGIQHIDGLADDVERIDGEVVELQSDVASINLSIDNINEEIDGVPESVYNLSSYTQNKGTANNDGTWSSYSSSNYKHIAIPVTVGDKLEIVAGTTYRARYGFLSDYSVPSANNTTVHFAPGCVCETIQVGETLDVFVPDGSAYIYVETLQAGTDCTPASITNLGKKSKVESLQYAFQVDFDAYDDTIISSAFAYKSGWYIVLATGKWNAGGNYGGISIPVFDAQKMVVKGSSYYLAFLKSAARTSGSLAPFCKGFNAVITGTQDMTFDIPADCKFVYFLRLNNNVNVLPDSCTLYFEKTEAVQRRRPIVSFVDDDAQKGQLEWLEPIVKATGAPITIALITTAVGATNYCTWDELRRFRNIGFRFVAHGATNITTMSVADLEALFISTQSAMEAHAMLDSDMFVLPNGAIDSTTRPVVEDYFKCSYSTTPRVNVVPLADKYLIRRVSIDSGAASLPSWKQWVDYAIKTRGWVIFYGHARGDNYDADMQTAYIELINYCKSNGVAILSLPDAWKECYLQTAND